MQSPAKMVVFSDLDGTLLDHDTYSWAAAQPALTALDKRRVPVVLTSSKTGAEIQKLQNDMGLSQYPAIAENGAGIVGIAAEKTDDDSPYMRLRKGLTKLSPDLRRHFRGFGDMADAHVAETTGLPLPDAARARQRQFSEPGLWSGSDDEKTAFIRQLQDKGIHAQQGGRFLTLSFGRTKADAMKEIAAHLNADLTIALGNAPNDIAMLEQADRGVIIANPHRDPLPTLKGEASGKIVRTSAPGPLGWNDAIHQLLTETDLGTE